jgi:peptide/nickel transport system ATP-binding protein
MREGRIVEAGEPWQIVHEPTDDYTRKLLASVPSPDPQHHRAS